MSAALAVGVACAPEVVPPLLGSKTGELASESSAQLKFAAHFAQFARFGEHFVDSSDYFNDLREEMREVNNAIAGAPAEANEDEIDTGELPNLKRTIHTMVRDQLQVPMTDCW